MSFLYTEVIALSFILLVGQSSPLSGEAIRERSPGGGDRGAQRARPPRKHVQITRAPEYTSSAPSIEIVRVSLVDSERLPLVRIELRNLVDEAVIGYEFEIHGSDPDSWVGQGALASLLASPRQVVIEPLGELTVDIPRTNFEDGDSLRLAAVLFASGRGEGDVEKVDGMRTDAATIHPSTP